MKSVIKNIVIAAIIIFVIIKLMSLEQSNAKVVDVRNDNSDIKVTHEYKDGVIDRIKNKAKDLTEQAISGVEDMSDDMLNIIQ